MAYSLGGRNRAADTVEAIRPQIELNHCLAALLMVLHCDPCHHPRSQSICGCRRPIAYFRLHSESNILSRGTWPRKPRPCPRRTKSGCSPAPDSVYLRAAAFNPLCKPKVACRNSVILPKRNRATKASHIGKTTISTGDSDLSGLDTVSRSPGLLLE
jgi:hypothetical protein